VFQGCSKKLQGQQKIMKILWFYGNLLVLDNNRLAELLETPLYPKACFSGVIEGFF
jgi:hypothetical protein